MSLSEHDKTVLLQEIQQIQQTLDHQEDFGKSVPGIEIDDLAEDIPETNLYGYEDDESVHSNVLVYQSQHNSDHDSSSSGSESTYSDAPTSSTHTHQRPRFGHFFKALETPGKSSSKNTSVYKPNEAQLVQPLFTSSPLPSLHSKVKERLQLQSDLPMVERKDVVLSLPTANMFSAASSVLSSDDGQLSTDISLPSTTVSFCKKEKIQMSNLYVERIFKNFRNRTKSPTIADANKIDARNLKSSANISTLENLLQVNRRYQNVLADELKKVQLAIKKNQKSQDELSDPLESNVQRFGMACLYKAYIGRFRPYFKDFNGIGPPDNENTLEIKKQMKIQPFTLGSKPWRVGETKDLKEGVYQNNLEKRLTPLLIQLKECSKDSSDKSRTKLRKKIAEIRALPKEEILKDSCEIDYFKIAKNFVPLREEFECRLQWLNVCHPAINQSKFTKEEDVKILTFAKKYKNCRWEEIAKSLDTRRTPVQCLQRFQRTLNKDILKTAWDAEDDKKLMEAVRLFGRNWVSISDYLGNRTSDQCIHRWEKSVNPNIKRGKWSEEEDALLINAVKHLGTKDWKTVKLYVPGRTDSQCRDRYMTSLDPTINWGPFSEEEDRKILTLAEKYGVGKWSMIAKEFPDRRDNQVWRRYKTINSVKYQKYRRNVIWKKNSVLTYFIHRKDEKRDYDLQEMDIKNIIPSMNKFEAHKVEKARSELESAGYSDEEVVRQIARMTYAGDFYKANDTRKKWTRKKRKEISTQELMTNVKELIANTDNPEETFCAAVNENNNDENENENGVESENENGVESENQDEDDEPLSSHCTKLVKAKRESPRRKHLLLSKKKIQSLEIFRGHIDDIFNAFEDGELAVENIQQDIVKCYKILEQTQPASTDMLIKELKQAEKKVNSYIKTQKTLLNQIIEQDQVQVVLKRQKRGVQSKRPPCAVVVEQRKRKTARPMKVVQYVKHSENPTTKPVKQEVVDDADQNDSSTPVPSIDFNLENEILTDYQALTTSTLAENVTATDQLKIFTLLLQALHVDTAGVMRSLPESHIVDGMQLNRPSGIGQIIPPCYPLSPNSATLKGFRSLLLYRRRLSECVNNRKKELGDISGTQLDPAVFRKTPMYEALSKRVKSLFIWPAFLATFMPRHVVTPSPSTKPPVIQTPVKFFTYMNPNKRMMITADKVRPETIPPSLSKNYSSRSTHTISSRQQERDQGKAAESTSAQSKGAQSDSIRRSFQPSQSNSSTSTSFLSSPKQKLARENYTNRKRPNVTNLTGNCLSGGIDAATSSTSETQPKKRKTVSKRKKVDVGNTMKSSSSIGSALISKTINKCISQSDAPSIIIEESHVLNNSSDKISLHEIEIKSESTPDSEVFIPKTNNVR